MGRIKHFKGETIDLEIGSNERKEAELSKNRLGDRSCFQTTGHIQAIPPQKVQKIQSSTVQSEVSTTHFSHSAFPSSVPFTPHSRTS